MLDETIAIVSMREAEEELAERIGVELTDDLLEACRYAGRQLGQEVDEDDVAGWRIGRSVEIGTAELVVLLIDFGEMTVDDVEEYASQLRENPVEKSALAVGRMASRESHTRRVCLSLYVRDSHKSIE